MKLVSVSMNVKYEYNKIKVNSIKIKKAFLSQRTPVVRYPDNTMSS